MRSICGIEIWNWDDEKIVARSKKLYGFSLPAPHRRYNLWLTMNTSLNPVIYDSTCCVKCEKIANHKFIMHTLRFCRGSITLIRCLSDIIETRSDKDCPSAPPRTLRTQEHPYPKTLDTSEPSHFLPSHFFLLASHFFLLISFLVSYLSLLTFLLLVLATWYFLLITYCLLHYLQIATHYFHFYRCY